ncbi:MAG: type II secretion system F family protein [Candidatus Omnitrophota bacterium]
MIRYKYRAKQGPDEITKGVVEASSKEEAVAKIGRMGLVPIGVEEDLDNQKKEVFSSRFLGKVKSRDITVFSRQFASLIRSGLPILRALSILKEQAVNVKMKTIIGELAQKVKKGTQLSEAMSFYPGAFSSFYIAMVKAGEDSGALQEMLARISDYRQRQEEFYSKVRTALAYPILILVVGILTIVAMMAFVMPRMLGIFSEMGQELPLVTQILINMSNSMRRGWAVIALAGTIIIFIFGRKSKTKAERIAFSLIKLRLPMLGEGVRKFELARFSRAFELLLNNGIQMLKAMRLSVPLVGNEIIRAELEQVYERLKGGASLAGELKKTKEIPLFMANMLAVGQESGRLGEGLAEIAGSYERDIGEAIKVVLSLIEPLLILAVGGVVSFIVVAMLLPIFQINLMK